MKNTQINMDQRQFNTFLAYWGMGSERSLDKLHRDYTTVAPEIKPKPCIKTLKNWSQKFNWQDKIKEMDEEANKKLFDEAVVAAKQTRVDIMKIFRAVVLKFAQQLQKNPNIEISSMDVSTFWKMARVEMGLPAENSKVQHEVGENLRDLILGDYEVKRDNTKSTD